MTEIVTDMPLQTHAAAVYEWDQKKVKDFTFESKFGDTVKLWRSTTSGKLLLPRAVCPISPVDRRSRGRRVQFHSSVKPRNEDQARVIREGVQRISQDESFIVECPTGFGKTVISMDYIKAMACNVIIFYTKDDIRTQWIDALKQFLGLRDSEIGLIKGDVCDYRNKKVVLASISTCYKPARLPTEVYSYFGGAIFDECHKVAADSFCGVCWQFNTFFRLGLSATVNRQDGKEGAIFAHIGPIAVKGNSFPMIPWIIQMKTNISISKKIQIQGGRMGHVNKILAGSDDRNRILCRFAGKLRRKGEEGIVIFSDLKDNHLIPIGSMLQQMGIPKSDIGLYVGGLNERQRETQAHKPIVLTTYAMTAEATNYPHWTYCIMGTPKANVAQIVGRVIREKDGKKTPGVFDPVDGGNQVLLNFASKRAKWYQSIGAKITYA